MNEESKVDKVEFKGSIKGIIIVISEKADVSDIIECISDKIEASKSFFNGAKIYNIESEFLSSDEIEKIKSAISDRFNLTFYDKENEMKNSKREEFILSEHDDRIVVEDTDKENPKTDKEYDSNSCKQKEIKFINGLRSGESDESYGNIVVMSDMKSGSMVVSGGDVLIMGNMYQGAKIVAEGNVVVMGELYGFIHAGSKGDKSAYIAAKNLKPRILQIADIMAEAPEESEYDRYDDNQSEVAFISDGRIVIDMRSSK